MKIGDSVTVAHPAYPAGVYVITAISSLLWTISPVTKSKRGHANFGIGVDPSCLRAASS
jgi:hypothetical protein